jgi:hypothetical protein
MAFTNAALASGLFSRRFTRVNYAADEDISPLAHR